MKVQIFVLIFIIFNAVKLTANPHLVQVRNCAAGSSRDSDGVCRPDRGSKDVSAYDDYELPENLPDDTFDRGVQPVLPLETNELATPKPDTAIDTDLPGAGISTTDKLPEIKTETHLGTNTVTEVSQTIFNTTLLPPDIGKEQKEIIDFPEADLKTTPNSLDSAEERGLTGHVDMAGVITPSQGGNKTTKFEDFPVKRFNTTYETPELNITVIPAHKPSDINYENSWFLDYGFILMFVIGLGVIGGCLWYRRWRNQRNNLLSLPTVAYDPGCSKGG